MYIIGFGLSKIWFPIRYLILLVFVCGLIEKIGIGFNLPYFLTLWISLFFLFLPSLAKSFTRSNISINPINIIRAIIERIDQIHYQKQREQQQLHEKETLEQAERIIRMQAEEAERQRQFEREKAEREARERSQYHRQQENSQQDHEKTENTRRGKKESKDPYEVLGVSPDMSLTEIRKAYLRLMNQYAPDHVSHLSEEFQKMAHEKCVAFNLAWEKIRKDNSKGGC
jgi:DnaJ-domain-containing protein 1